MIANDYNWVFLLYTPVERGTVHIVVGVLEESGLYHDVELNFSFSNSCHGCSWVIKAIKERQ